MRLVRIANCRCALVVMSPLPPIADIAANGLHGRNHSCPTRFALRHLLARKMVDLDNLWFSLGVVMVISLLATITALTVQGFVGMSLTSILIGPFIAAALVIIYSRCRSAK